MTISCDEARDIAESALTVRLKTTIGPGGETTVPLVHCPKEGATIDARRCGGCMRLRSLEWEPERGGEVRCLASNRRSLDGRADLAEAAARTTVLDASGSAVTCVTPDVPLSRLRALFTSKRRRAVAVVDADGRLEALVSRSDLVNAPAFGTVADVMTAPVHALPENAPLSYAISLLAGEDLAEVPVVRADGTVTGMCHALDIARWLAERLGYAVSG